MSEQLSTSPQESEPQTGDVIEEKRGDAVRISEEERKLREDAHHTFEAERELRLTRTGMLAPDGSYLPGFPGHTRNLVHVHEKEEHMRTHQTETQDSPTPLDETA